MPNREDWLQGASEVLNRDYVEKLAGLDLRPYSVSVGFPKGSTGRIKPIGQCFDARLSGDNRANIFICPTQVEPLRVLDVLLHELIHVATPGEGHQGRFIAAAQAVGLVKPWTRTTASLSLKVELQGLAGLLGPYPHGGITLPERVKAGSNLKLWKCECTKIRTGKKGDDALDLFCNRCNSQMMKVD